MMKLAKSVLFCVVLLYSVNNGESSTRFDRSQCRKGAPANQGLLVRGKPSQKDSWPWLAALHTKKDGKYFGMGSLISERFVLTAAHCLQDKEESKCKNPEDVDVWLGKWNLAEKNETGAVKATAAEFKMHPDWNISDSRWDADIAIVKLAEDVELSRKIQPICLWTSKMQPDEENDGGTAVGWGRTENQGFGEHSNVPYQAELKVLLRDACYQTELHHAMSHRGLCMIGDNSGPCNGDSGGGLFSAQGRKWFLRGITSTGLTNVYMHCDVTKPTIYTNVAMFTDWIVPLADLYEIKEFFVKTHLQNSIRWGEILKVDVSVFNYIAFPKNSINAKVTLYNLEGEFEFIELSPSGRICKIKPLSEQQQTKSVTVESQAGSSTFFLIRAKNTGKITFSLKAEAIGYSDEMETEILVEHEEDSEIKNYPYLIDLIGRNYQHERINLYIPEHAIENSIFIEASASSDLVGPPLRNVDNIIRMSSEEPEHKFKSWIQNIVAFNYLKSVGKVTVERENTVKTFLASGVEQVLKQQKSDGSFSFLKESGAKSVWLTAYIVKMLKQSREHAVVDVRGILRAINFIKAQQNVDGSFTEAVQRYHYISQTGSQKGIAMTAFVAIAFLETGLIQDKSVDKSLSFLDSNSVRIDDNLALAMSAYAFALNKHKNTQSFLRHLLENAFFKDDGMFWYRYSRGTSSDENESITIEIAAYAIMAFVTGGREVEALPIVRWLLKHQNSAGTFHSTTDTVLAIQALTMINTKLYSPNVDMQIKLSYDRDRQHTFTINSASSTETQYKMLERDVRQFGYSATGSGFALFQIRLSYSTNLLNPVRQFDLTAERLATSTHSLLNLKVCVKFIPSNTLTQSGMTVIEINLPSGYKYEASTPDNVKVGVRRTKTQNQKSVIVLYFDSIGTTQVCPEVVAVRSSIVSNTKKSVITVYDYYSPEQRATAFYSIGGVKEVCEV